MDLRHLKYFVAVVDYKGYREASRRLHVSQAALSQTILDLEGELDVKLFSRAKRTVHLTAQGDVFYQEALRTLEQAERAVDSVKRVSRGEIGVLSVGYFGCATYSFMPELIRKYRETHPGVKLVLKHMGPARQEEALEQGLLDVGFSRVVRSNQALKFCSKLLFKNSLVVAMPNTRKLSGPEVRIADLARDRFVLLNRDAYPPLFDTIVGLCAAEGFSPKVEHAPSEPQTIFTLIAAGEGIAIVPEWFKNLRTDGVQFTRLVPDTAKVELALVWMKDSRSAVLHSFLEVVDESMKSIRRAALHK